MANSKVAEGLRPANAARVALHLAMTAIVFAAGLVLGWVLRPALAPASIPAATPLPAHVARYRVRYGGDVITQYLTNVTSVTVYRTPAAIDQVVFNLDNGWNWVLNADMLVDYALPADGSVGRLERLNELYNHYDPYLQGDKQELHRQWVIEQYGKYVGRPPTDAEWLAALNELTRGVEHRQLALWIQYSPPALSHFVQERFRALAGRDPSAAELRLYYRKLIDGGSYEAVEQELAAALAGKR